MNSERRKCSTLGLSRAAFGALWSLLRCPPNYLELSRHKTGRGNNNGASSPDERMLPDIRTREIENPEFAQIRRAR